MPQVARMVGQRRERFGNTWVTKCIERSMAGEPGWFFAREGALAFGTPPQDPDLANFAAAQVTSTQALVVMREPEEHHGQA